MAMDPVSALVAIGRLAEINWKAVADQYCFTYNDEDGKTMVLPEDTPLVRHRTSGSKVGEGGHPEIRPKYREEFAHCEMTLEYAHLAWCRYLANDKDLKNISTLEG